jgi:putative transposase
MPYNPQIHHRRSIRLKGYDYTQPGAYFFTLTTWQRAALFGEIVNHEMHLNSTGKIIAAEWQRLEQRFPNLQLDSFVVMPNHVHGIIRITEPNTVRATRPSITRAGQDDDGSPRQEDDYDAASGQAHGPAAGSLGAILGQFKSRITKRLSLAIPVWQRDYYERIIRDEGDWERIRQYIKNNPSQWEQDDEYVG